MRLDKWLWAARFYKTRSLAVQAIELGRVRVAGARVKPAHEVRVDQRIELTQGELRIEIDVRGLSEQRGPAPVARQLYEESADSIARRERVREARAFGAEPAAALKGRPTKRDARELRRARGDDDPAR